MNHNSVPLIFTACDDIITCTRHVGFVWQAWSLNTRCYVLLCGRWSFLLAARYAYKQPIGARQSKLTGRTDGRPYVGNHCIIE